MPELRTETRGATCEECGAEFSYLVTILAPGRELPPEAPPCEACRERGDTEAREREEEERRLRAEGERAGREERIHQLLQRAGVNPRSHGHCTLTNFRGQDNPDALKAAQEFLEAIRLAGDFEYIRGLFFAGETGLGKSHLAVALVRRLLLEGWDPETILFERAGKLVATIQDSYSRGNTLELMATRERARIWVLDDLGAEKPSPDVARILTELLSAREGWPTVLTSNLAPAALLDRYPEFSRVVSRLGPRCFTAVHLQGRDQRYREDR